MSTTFPARRVVAGVDASEHAARAAEWAAAEAAARNLPLHLLHARETAYHAPSISPLPYDMYRAMERTNGDRVLAGLCRALERRYPALPITTAISDGTPAEALVEASRTAELLVAGTRGHGGFAGALLGSVSLRLAAHAHCPTVIVRGEPTESTESTEFGHGPIVLGVDSGEPPEAVAFAFAEAARVHAPLTVIHTWQPRGLTGGAYEVDLAMIEQSERALLADLVKEQQETFPEVETTTVVAHGHPAEVLIEASREARLLVVAAHRHRGPLSVGVGPVVHGLLHHAHSPIAVIPAV